MNPRQAARQQEPKGIDGSFPSRVHRRRTWFRAHTDRPGADRGCWYFASTPGHPAAGEGGRFDLPSPRGTCYLAATEVAAARERLGRPGRLVAVEETQGVVVSRVRYEPGRVADLLHRDAALHGGTRELSASSPYRLSQRWAHAVDLAGFAGIVYPPRFSTDPVEALAAFGEAGVPKHPRSVVDSAPLAAVLEKGGCTVIGPPAAESLGPLLA